MLRLPNDWIWDSWVVNTGDEYHLFFLKAPRSLVDPARRHEAATIGHAMSTDLSEWTYQGDALVPAACSWDIDPIRVRLCGGGLVARDDGAAGG